MELEALDLTTWLPVAPEALYRAWLDPKAHAAFTGAEASVQPKLDGVFYAWDGYITGCNLELEPGRRILQSWSTAEFPEGHPPSLLEVLLDADAGGTRITLKHTDIPEGQADAYEQFWEDHYFVPMRTYFLGAGGKGAGKKPKGEGKPKAAKRAAPKKAEKKPVAKRKAAPKKKPAPKKGKGK